MSWDKSTHEKITTERLLLLPPDRVYDELKSYGEFLKNNKWSGKEELEKALYARNDKLINLGLAQFASKDEIVLEIYKSSQTKSEAGKDYNLALRIACLSNVVTAGFLSGFLDKIDLKELLQPDYAYELSIYLSNPTAPEKELENLFRRTSDFANVPDSDWVHLIHFVTKNPRLNSDESSDSGPDLGHWNLHKAIFEMLETAPATAHALQAIDGLLSGLNPKHVCSPDELQPVLDRWKAVEVNDYKGKPREGHFTGLNARDEFLCQIASLYGRSFKNNQTRIFGSVDSQDVVLRCAYYGKADMKLKEMQAAFNRDKEVFLFAALNNFNLFFDKKRRKFLEENVGGYLMYRYKFRCEQVHAENRFFDPRPLNDEFWDFEDHPPIEKKSNELTVIEKILAQQGKLEKQLAQLKSYLFWGAVIVLIAIAHYAH